jgi:ketosteroid isomerase-like protein
VREVLAANQAFYEAFEHGDIDAMSEVWEHSDRVVCTHPGWGSLRGWGAVSGSWVALFGGGSALQFIVTSEHVDVVGDAAWVTLDENLLSDQGAAAVSAVNVFARTDGGWRMVVHHASPVAGP